MSKIKFHHLKPTPGSTKSKIRKGRGEAGKRGKTAGRGTKGTGARKTVPAYFEGGQIPLYRRIPKLKGLKNTPKMSYVVVNVSDLQDKNLKGDIDPEILQKNGLTRKKGFVKIYLEVAKNNTEAVSFYKKMNFKIFNSRKNYYLIENKKIEALLMSKNY